MRNILALESHTTKVCVEHSDYTKCIKILRQAIKTITSLEQETKKNDSNKKRLILAKARLEREQETETIRQQEVEAKMALEETNKELAIKVKRKEEELKIMHAKMKLQLKRLQEERGMRSITDGSDIVGHGTRASEKRKRVQLTSGQLRVLIANAKMEYESSKSTVLGDKASYNAVLEEKANVKKLSERADGAERELFQVKLESLATVVKTRFEALDASTEMSRMYNHRVIDLEFQLENLNVK